MAMNGTALWLITGARQSGKSTFCRGIIDSARQARWDVAGLLSPARIEEGIKTGIFVEDVRTGETHLLASNTHMGKDDLVLGNWYFDRQTLTWGNHVLTCSPPCDLLVVDELGPLEFIHQIGWQSALKILPQRQYQLALVIVRPELQAIACKFLDFSKIIEIDQTQPTITWVGTFWPQILEYKIDI